MAENGAAHLALDDLTEAAVLLQELPGNLGEARGAAGVHQEDAAGIDVRPARQRSRIYSPTTFSMEPRYFFTTDILPSMTSMQGCSFKRLAPRAVTAEQRPPFFM